MDSAFSQAKVEWDDPEDAIWWAIPKSAIVTSEDGIEARWFEPAKTKTYRQQGQYGFVGKKSRKKTGDR